MEPKEVIQILGVSSTSSVEITSSSEGKQTAKIKVYHENPFEAYNTAVLLDDAAQEYMRTDKVRQFKVEGATWKVVEEMEKISGQRKTDIVGSSEPSSNVAKSKSQ